MTKDRLKRISSTFIIIVLLGGAIFLWRQSILERTADDSAYASALGDGYLPDGALTFVEKEVLQLLERPRRINLDNEDHVYAIRDWRQNGRILYFNQEGEIKDAAYLALILAKDPAYGRSPFIAGYWVRS